MARTPKYQTADDLINHCEIKNLCFVWPQNDRRKQSGRWELAPVLSPASPMAVSLQTNSVARLLFITCRYIPASRRLVKWCNTPSCVNPYHHSEDRETVQKRFVIAGKTGKAGGFFTDLLPEQEKIRHVLPSPEVIESARPMELEVLKLLQESAMLSGVDARGLPPAIRQHKELPTERMNKVKPLLVMTRYRPPKPDVTPEERAQIDADMEPLWDGTIFRQIEERKKRLLQKAVQDWDLPRK